MNSILEEISTTNPHIQFSVIKNRSGDHSFRTLPDKVKTEFSSILRLETSDLLFIDENLFLYMKSIEDDYSKLIRVRPNFNCYDIMWIYYKICRDQFEDIRTRSFTALLELSDYAVTVEF